MNKREREGVRREREIHHPKNFVLPVFVEKDCVCVCEGERSAREGEK